ncbi:hypothetical protein TKK_0018121 [Trichogramma kaykai]|uniref:Guanine nucleotide exchange factor for Rab-3A n=1 Tax=Trichogramma kaykai TaxID=54128 RepID=A0ABD2W0L3_9HYME
MKSVQLQEQQQPSSMESSDGSAAGATMIAQSEYAYRPLTTKHRRAGSTGTTGDEEYTTDEDDVYADEADCCAGLGAGLGSLHHHHQSHTILVKSDLARAATDLFGYDNEEDESKHEPTGLFDEDDSKLCRQSSTKSMSILSYNNGSLPRGVLARRRASAGSDKECGRDTAAAAAKSQQPLDRRLPEEKSPAECNGETLRDSSTAGQDDAKPLDIELSEGSSSNGDEQQLPLSNGIADKEGEKESDDAASERERTNSALNAQEAKLLKLQEELRRAHEQLQLKDEEVSRLSRIRQDVEAELEELTASLFQEAHNMVREANQRQATAERLLEESRMKSEVLAAEVAALKTLVLTSTPARPNPHLHPQIAGGGCCDDCHHHHGHQSGIFAKKHRRSPSHFNLKYGRESSPPDSPMREQRTSLPAADQPARSGAKDEFFAQETRDLDKERDKERERDHKRDRERGEKESGSGVEVDPRVHSEFLRWKENPAVDKSDPFIERIFREDIDLCLDFPNVELAAKVRQAVLDGIIFVEAVSDKAKLGFPKKCALLEAPRQCHYRMRMGDQENQWHSISQICRNRIIAVCDFLNYLRYIERGLVKSSIHDIYWEITRLRKEMVLARLGLALSV